jgi:hypothetical protein
MFSKFYSIGSCSLSSAGDDSAKTGRLRSAEKRRPPTPPRCLATTPSETTKLEAFKKMVTHPPQE